MSSPSWLPRRENVKISHGYHARLNIETPSGRYGHHTQHLARQQEQRATIIYGRRGGYATSLADLAEDQHVSGVLYQPQPLAPQQHCLEPMSNEAGERPHEPDDDSEPTQDSSLDIMQGQMPFVSPPTPRQNSPLGDMQDMPPFVSPPTPGQADAPEDTQELLPFVSPPTPPWHRSSDGSSPPFVSPPTPGQDDSLDDTQDMPPFVSPPTPTQDFAPSGIRAPFDWRHMPMQRCMSDTIPERPPFISPPTPTQYVSMDAALEGPPFVSPPTPIPHPTFTSQTTLQAPFQSPPTPVPGAGARGIPERSTQHSYAGNLRQNTFFGDGLQGPQWRAIGNGAGASSGDTLNADKDVEMDYDDYHADEEDFDMDDAPVSMGGQSVRARKDGGQAIRGRGMRRGQGGGKGGEGLPGGWGTHDGVDQGELFEALLAKLKKSPNNIPVTKGDFSLFLQSLRLELLRKAEASGPSPPGRAPARPKTSDIRHRPDSVKALAKLVRSLTCRCMGRKRVDPIRNHHLPNPDDLKYYERTKDIARGPKIPNLKVDIGRPGSVSSRSKVNLWNERAAIIVADEFFETYQEDHERWTHSQVQRAFKNHLKSLRRKLQDTLKEEVVQGYDRASRERQARRKSRGIMEFRRRIQGWELFSADKAVADQLKIWEDQHYDGFISESWSDGSDSEHEQYFRRARPYHRNPDLDAYFRLPALLQLSTHYQEGGRKTVGQMPHLRDTGPNPKIVRKERVPVGLPENFYNPEFLNSLEIAQIEALNMQPPVKIEFPAYIIRFASRFERIRTPAGVPAKAGGIATSLAHLVASAELPQED